MIRHIPAPNGSTITPRIPFLNAVPDEPIQVSAPNHVANIVPIESIQPSLPPAMM